MVPLLKREMIKDFPGEKVLPFSFQTRLCCGYFSFMFTGTVWMKRQHKHFVLCYRGNGWELPKCVLGCWVMGTVSLWGAPHICAGHIGGVLGISLELLTCCGYRDRLQTVGGNVSIFVSGKVSKISKSLPGWPCHVHTPKLGFTCSPHISESVLWLCSVTLCYFSCKCSSPTSLWCFSMVQPFLS